MTGNLQNWGKKALNIKPAPLEHLVSEINSVVVTKLYNIKNGTATEREKQVVFECLGLRNASSGFRIAERMGLIEVKDKPVVFWFETQGF